MIGFIVGGAGLLGLAFLSCHKRGSCGGESHCSFSRGCSRCSACSMHRRSCSQDAGSGPSSFRHKRSLRKLLFLKHKLHLNSEQEEVLRGLVLEMQETRSSFKAKLSDLRREIAQALSRDEADENVLNDSVLPLEKEISELKEKWKSSFLKVHKVLTKEQRLQVAQMLECK